jgi:hypothetical protein
MNLELILQEELTEDERNILAQDGERWKRMGAGQHLDDWLSFGPGQLIRRTSAMKVAHTNRPEGRAYNETMRALLRRDGLHTMDKKAMTAVLWLHENAEHLAILREIRSTMTEGERSRLNSPITAQQRVRKVLQRRTKDPDNNPHVSPLADLRHQLLEKTREIAHLQERLAAAENDGSLFDLRSDSIDDIARTIVNTIAPARAKKLADTISAKLKVELMAKAKPAG